MEALGRLGAKSVPVVAVGERFVFAQSLADVAALLGIAYDATPELSPDELVGRLGVVLATAGRLVRQLPDRALAAEVMDRKRSYRELAHHLFRVVDAFLDVACGRERVFELDALNAPPPEAMRSFDDIAAYGAGVARRLAGWWDGESDRTGARPIETYWGRRTLHEVLERTAWHAAQHVRQLAMLLDGFGIAPDRPLSEADLAGLPVPEKVWDD